MVKRPATTLAAATVFGLAIAVAGRPGGLLPYPPSGDRSQPSLPTGNHFYASPSGKETGDGSLANPWPLQIALNQPGKVRPGDTIWLTGGTYSGSFTSNLNGTASNPILVRQAAGERALLDGGNSKGNAILVASGSYTWFWGFEITSSDPIRSTSDTGSWPSGTALPRGEGILVDQSSPHPGLKFVNLIIHDTRQGISFWKEAVDGEIYGCLVYDNGWSAADRGHGHGIYVQNQTGTKNIADNVIFSGFSHGVHGYGSAKSFLDNIHLVGNTIFNAGDLSSDGGRNVLLGGGAVVHNPVLDSNLVYRSRSQGDSDIKLNYGGGCEHPVITNNYIVTSVDINCTSMTVSGNTFYSNPLGGISPSLFAQNVYRSTRPSGWNVFVRPNRYDPARAHITVYNWDRASTVTADVSAVLSPGDHFEIRNAQDALGAAVVTGVYSGGRVPIPVSGLPPARPGRPTTGSDFNVFVLSRIEPSREPVRTVPPADSNPTPLTGRKPVSLKPR